MDAPSPLLTTSVQPVAERRLQGKALREKTPRRYHSAFQPAASRPDTLDLVTAQDSERLQHLLPIKYGRMIASPFAFFRGSAGIMAYDLASTPTTHIMVQLVGDAHISNFGVFASPERHLVFDINDFDETHPGSWEWDLKRLVASILIAGRENGFAEPDCANLVMDAVRVYQTAMQRASDMNVLDLWYYHVDTDLLINIQNLVQVTRNKQMDAMLRKAQARTQRRSLEKLTDIVDGVRRIRSEPPLLVPLHEMTDAAERERTLAHAWTTYKESLPEERRHLLERYAIVDAGLRVGGVGSVGTRCYITLLQGRDVDDCIILQQKETAPSCLAPYFPKHPFQTDAERVVRGQRAIQATSDIFLGWHRGADGKHDFYWRQLADMKGSAEISMLDSVAFRGYVSVCAVCLARAHARTGDAAMISGYIGSTDALPEALAAFAIAYANQNERDYDVLVKAARAGRIPVQEGV